MSSTLTSEAKLDKEISTPVLTADEAAQRLLQSPQDFATPDALMALAAQVSVAHAQGQPTDRAVLYSGEVDNGPPKLSSWRMATQMQQQDKGVLIIDITERGRFLTSEPFQEALIRVFEDEGFESFADVTQARNSKANKFLFDAENGAWAQASRSFAQALKGDVVTLTSKADMTRTFGQVELPALLNNPNINTINGIPQSVLKQLAAQPNGQAFVFKALAEKSRAMLNQCALAWDKDQRIAHVDTAPMLGRSSPLPDSGDLLGPPKLIHAGHPDEAILQTLTKAKRLLQYRWLARVLGVKVRRRT